MSQSAQQATQNAPGSTNAYAPVSFTVHGEVKALKRHGTRVVVPKHGKPFSQNYDPKENRDRKENIGWLARKAMLEAGRSTLFDCPLRVDIYQTVLRPESRKRKSYAKVALDKFLHMIFPTSKPDGDNVVKLILDALSKVVWTDDSRVTTITYKKRFTDAMPHTWVHIQPEDPTGCGLSTDKAFLNECLRAAVEMGFFNGEEE